MGDQPDFSLKTPLPPSPPPPPKFTLEGQAKKVAKAAAPAVGLALFRLLPSRAITRAIVKVGELIIAENVTQYAVFTSLESLFPPIEGSIDAAKEAIGFKPKPFVPSGIVRPNGFADYAASIGQATIDLTNETIQDVMTVEQFLRDNIANLPLEAFHEFEAFLDRGFGKPDNRIIKLFTPNFAPDRFAVPVPSQEQLAAALAASLDDPAIDRWNQLAAAQNYGYAVAEYINELLLRQGYDPRVGFVTAIRNEMADP